MLGAFTSIQLCRRSLYRGDDAIASELHLHCTKMPILGADGVATEIEFQGYAPALATGDGPSLMIMLFV